MAIAITTCRSRPTPTVCRLPVFMIPLIAGSIWLLMLISLIATWISRGSPHYPEMWSNQNLAYISNTGATFWGQPVFAVGSTITALLFSITFAFEKWFQSRDALIRSDSRHSLGLSIATAFFTLAGSCSLVLLTLFNVRQHPLIHYSNVGVFLFGYILAASCTCAEKGYLSRHFPSNANLRRSFYVKLIFIACEIVLGVIFVVTMYERLYAASVVTEWIIGMLFAFYLSTLTIDFFCTEERMEEMEEEKTTREYVRIMSWDEAPLLAAPCRVHLGSSVWGRSDEEFV